MPEPLYCGPLTIARGSETRDLGWCSISRLFPHMPIDDTTGILVRIRTERGRHITASVAYRDVRIRRVERPTLDGVPFVFWETRLSMPCCASWRGDRVELRDS